MTTGTPIAVDPKVFNAALSTVTSTISSLYLSRNPSIPPSSSSPPNLHTILPTIGLGLTPALTHLLSSLLPTLSASSLSAHYYGFVTGGVTPAALLADYLVSTLDQNVQVHLPADTAATVIESCSLTLLLQLFRMNPECWGGRCFTTGATGANVLGLLCARETLVPGAATMGLLKACMAQGVLGGVSVFAAMPHASIKKAAAIVGFGSDCIIDIGLPDEPWCIDLPRLAYELDICHSQLRRAIVVVGYGEVNTGRFDDGLRAIRDIVDGFYQKVWIHVDAAFGIFARLLDDNNWATDLEEADSVAGDAHKLLNVPYDCGFFFTRDSKPLTDALRVAAPYLNTTTDVDREGEGEIISPLYTHLENSNRFRALPVYATLTAYGSSGYKALVHSLVSHSRAIAEIIQTLPAYELLNGGVEDIFIVVLFRHRDSDLNEGLGERINKTGRMYVSPSVWQGRKAVKCAAGNWRVQKEGPEGVGVVEEVLREVGNYSE